ncbi:MAG TPA: ABC transporter permease [Dehalococcoidia bacterium]|nr:ABC transporter permease [Dehalococcoidia bacterium]
MNKTLLILRHEFRHTVRRRAFIIMTLIVPLIVLLLIGVSQLVSGIARPTVEAVTIGYVDELGGFQQYTTQGNITMVRFGTPNDATEALITGNISEYFVIPPDYISTGVIHRYTLEKQLAASPAITAAINIFLTSNLLTGKVPAATIARIESPLNLVSTRLTETGAVAPEQGGYENLVIPFVFGFLLALSIIFSSTYLLQGLGEEKENRLIEILLSSVSARQLLTGKVLGIGAAGLVQVAVWVISAPLLLNLASSSIGGFISTIRLPANLVVLAIVYFILGYLLFAVISAAIGAISSNSREGQQLIGVFTVPALIPLWFTSLLILFPGNRIWAFFTIFPLSSPVEVIMRLGVSVIPPWQLIASIAVLVLTIIGILFLTIRIFRTYLLMYGKRPGVGEVLRNLGSG